MHCCGSALMRMRIRIQLFSGGKPMRIHANPDPDPDPDHTLSSLKVDFLHESLYVIGHKICICMYKYFFERLEIGFICKFWSISLLLDPDPHSQCGSGTGSTTLLGTQLNYRTFTSIALNRYSLFRILNYLSKIHFSNAPTTRFRLRKVNSFSKGCVRNFYILKSYKKLLTLYALN
jgi:hypothetical protein